MNNIATIVKVINETGGENNSYDFREMTHTLTLGYALFMLAAVFISAGILALAALLAWMMAWVDRQLIKKIKEAQKL